MNPPWPYLYRFQRAGRGMKDQSGVTPLVLLLGALVGVVVLVVMMLVG